MFQRINFNFYIKYFTNFRRLLVFSIGSSVIQAGLLLPVAFLVKYIIDTLIASRQTNEMVLVGIAIVFLYTLRNYATYYFRHLIFGSINSAIENMQMDLMTKTHAFSLNTFFRFDRNKVQNTLVRDVDRIRQASYRLMGSFIPSIVIGLGLALILIYLNWGIFLALSIIILPLTILAKRLGAKLTWQSNIHTSANEGYIEKVLFAQSFMQLTKLMAFDSKFLETFSTHVKQTSIEGLSHTRIKDQYHLIQNTLVAIAGILVLVLGGISVVNGGFSIGDLLSFYFVLSILQRNLNTIIESVSELIDGNISLSKIQLYLTSEENRPYNGNEEIEFSGLLKLRSVQFNYNQSGNNKLLEDINLALKPGKITLILGPNGSGKTTIVNLMLGIISPLKGELLADDVYYRKLNIPSLRRQMGLVPQNPLLFNGTIVENIMYGHSKVSKHQVEKAAILATAHDFIEKLPNKYNTNIGDFAFFLSGGQRQRIAIARALIARPPLLIFDEPTNHLDIKVIEQLTNKIDSLDFNPAIFIISHHTSLLDIADSAYNLKDGILKPISRM